MHVINHAHIVYASCGPLIGELINMYVCMYVCMYGRTCVRMYVCMYVERWVVSLSYHLQDSTWFFNAQPHPQNLLSLVNHSTGYWTIYQLFQVLCLENLQGLEKMPPAKKPPHCLLLSLIHRPLKNKVFKKTRYRDIFQ